jgi:hypothetical protein
MTAPSSSCTHQSWRSGVTSSAFSARKQQALVVLLSQQLMETQFVRADHSGSARLWQEVAALEIDGERIVNLLYAGIDVSDRAALNAEDDAWIANHRDLPQRRWGLQHLHRSRNARRPERSFSLA